MAPLVLAIEPDLRQAAIVKRIVREKVLADVTVVDSRENALEAMRSAMPDVLLLSALLSPRDEDELIAHLRTLEAAEHLQTHTIPQLASSIGPDAEDEPRGLLSAFRRKKKSDVDGRLRSRPVRRRDSSVPAARRRQEAGAEGSAGSDAAGRLRGAVAPGGGLGPGAARHRSGIHVIVGVAIRVEADLGPDRRDPGARAVDPDDRGAGASRRAASPDRAVDSPGARAAPAAGCVARAPATADPRLRIADARFGIAATAPDWRIPEFRVRIRRVRVPAASPADESDVPETVLSSHGKPSDRDGERTRALA